MLGRAYITSAASLVRSSFWIAGMEGGYRLSNYLSFAASLRGLVEAAADSMYSLEPAPLTLAELFKDITGVLNNDTLSHFIMSPKLEEKLIHFVYAKKPAQSNKGLTSHKALRARDYIDVLRRFNNKLEQFTAVRLRNIWIPKTI